MARTFQINTSISCYARFDIHAKENETIEDILKLEDEELISRIKDFAQVIDQIEDNDIDINDIQELK